MQNLKLVVTIHKGDKDSETHLVGQLESLTYDVQMPTFMSAYERLILDAKEDIETSVTHVTVKEVTDMVQFEFGAGYTPTDYILTVTRNKMPDVCLSSPLDEFV